MKGENMHIFTLRFLALWAGWFKRERVTKKRISCSEFASGEFRQPNSGKRTRPDFQKRGRSAAPIAQRFFRGVTKMAGKNRLVLQGIKKSCYTLIMCVILPSGSRIDFAIGSRLSRKKWVGPITGSKNSRIKPGKRTWSRFWDSDS